MELWLVAGVGAGIFLLLLPATLLIKWKGAACALFLRCLCTAAACLPCFLGAVWGRGPFGWWMAAGMAACFLSDLIIKRWFLGGTAAFLFAIACFMVAFCLLQRPTKWVFAVFLPLFAVCALLFRKTLRAMGPASAPYVFYLAALLLMVSFALLLPATQRLRGILLAAGGFLFMLSNFLFARNILVKCSPLSDAASLSCYCGGLYLFSLAVLLFTP